MSQSSTAETRSPKGNATPREPTSIGQLWVHFRWPLLILVAYIPMLLVHFSWLWREPQYQFFPILLAVVAYLIWSRLEPRPEHAPGPQHRIFAYTLLAVSWMILAVATVVVNSPWSAAFSFILSCGAVLLLIAERFYLQNRFGIWLLLCLLLPLPLGLDHRLARGLQKFTTLVSADILERIGVPNIADGTIITLSTKQLFVEEACSGVVSMMSIITACLVLAVVSNRPAVHTALLVGSGVIWAATTNILRIVILAYSQHQFEFDLSEGWPHDLLGLCLFAIAVLLASSADRFIEFVVAPIESDEVNTSFSTWSVQFWDRIMSFGGESDVDVIGDRATFENDKVAGKRFAPQFAFGAAFLVLGIAATAITGTHWLSTADETLVLTPTGQLEFVNGLSQSTMPAELEGWKLVDYGQTHAERLFAQESRLWTYRKGGMQAIFSVDFVFDEFHDLCVCYDSIGWEQTLDTLLMRPQDAPIGPYLQAKFSKNVISNGYLLFSHLNSDGTHFEPPVSLASRLQKRIIEGPFSREREKRLFQVQLWLTSNRPVDPAEQVTAHAMFLQLRSIIQKQLAGQS